MRASRIRTRDTDTAYMCTRDNGDDTADDNDDDDEDEEDAVCAR